MNRTGRSSEIDLRVVALGRTRLRLVAEVAHSGGRFQNLAGHRTGNWPDPGRTRDDGVSTAAVGIDIGTSNTKVVRVARGAAVTLLDRPTLAGLEQLLEVVRAGLRSAAAAGPVDAVGIASVAESGYPLAADDRPLTLLLSWRDSRDDTEIRRWRTGLAPTRAVRGDRRPPRAEAAAGRLARLRSRHPATFAGMHRWASPMPSTLP